MLKSNKNKCAKYCQHFTRICSNSNVLMLRSWWYLQSDVKKKKKSFQKLRGGEPHSEYWGSLTPTRMSVSISTYICPYLSLFYVHSSYFRVWESPVWHPTFNPMRPQQSLAAISRIAHIIGRTKKSAKLSSTVQVWLITFTIGSCLRGLPYWMRMTQHLRMQRLAKRQ